MAGNPTSKGLASGLGKESSDFENSHSGHLPLYQRAVVREVFFDPAELTDEQIEDLRGKIRFTQNVRNLPRNTILGERIKNGQTNITGYELFFPFFSPHLELPIK